MFRRSIVTVAVLAVAVLAALALGGCGDGEDEARDAKLAAPASADVERYCALAKRLDASGTEFFAALERENADEDEFQAAERRFLERYAAEFAEIERLAPREIKADVRTVLAATRQRAGLEAPGEVSEVESSAAERRVQAYEKRECP